MSFRSSEPYPIFDFPPLTGAQDLVVSLEVCMAALGLPLKPPPPVNLAAVSAEQLMPAGVGGAGGLESGGAVEGEQGGEFAPREEADAGEPVVVEESTGPKHRLALAAAAGGGSAARGMQQPLPGGAGGGRHGGGGGSSKKLGVKDRLRKKLGL